MFIALFTFTYLFSGIQIFLRKYGNYILLLTGIVLFLFAALRHENVGRDYEVYADLFRTFSSQRFNPILLLFYEPSYFVFPILFYSLGLDPVIPTMVVFAIIGVGLKMYSLRISPSIFLSIILYVSSFFLLHEMTQVRVGAASAIFLASLPLLKQKKYLKYILVILIATAIHYSSILYILLIFFNKSFKQYYLLVPLFFLFLITSILKINLIEKLGFTQLTPKTEFYVDAIENGFENELNIFNYNILIAILFFFLLFAKRVKLMKYDSFFDVLLKSHLFSLILYFAFSSTAIFSMRLYELFGVTQMILYAYAYIAFRYKIIPIALISLIALLNFLNYTIINSIFNNYFTWI